MVMKITGVPTARQWANSFMQFSSTCSRSGRFVKGGPWPLNRRLIISLRINTHFLGSRLMGSSKLHLLDDTSLIPNNNKGVLRAILLFDYLIA